MIVRAVALGLMLGGAASAAEYPAPVQGDYVAHDFRFHDGTVLPELKLHYTTVGAKTGASVLILHGTTGTGAGMLTPDFAGQLFGPGQPLDATKYFIILPDSIGAGQSGKPSDGMHARFPHYDYADMVRAQHEMLTQGLGIQHLRLVMGNSMGGMETWVWGETYPRMMDGLVPMASQPTAMASRNWIMRRMVIDSVRNDPEWQGGDYTVQPKLLHFANVWFAIATSGGTMAYAQQAPTREAADKLLAARLAQPTPGDANDIMYQWEASSDYDAAPKLDAIEAPVLVINSADDERNPPETGLLEAALKRVKHVEYVLIPASTETRGHGTTAFARFYADALGRFMAGLKSPAQ